MRGQLSRFEVADDATSGDWLLQSGTIPSDLITFGPMVYPAYARLNYADATLEDDAEAPTDITLVREMAVVLGTFTTTPDDCYFCVWDGYAGSFLSDEFARLRKRVQIPGRDYVLFTGPLSALHEWENEFGRGGPAPAPAFMWPRDRRWCFTSDVDTEWATIGAERAAVEKLITRSPRAEKFAPPTV